MANRNPSALMRSSKHALHHPDPTPPSRHVYVVMYSERAGPVTTPLPYHRKVTAFTNGISLTPKDLNETYTIAAPSATGAQRVEVVTLSNRENHAQTMSFIINTMYGPPTTQEPGGDQQVWICGWTDYKQEAVWIMEETIRREEVGEGKGLSTLQPEWKWEEGPGGYLNKAIWETETGNFLQYDVLRVEVQE
ncbi:hypothetical protein HBI79_119150 [Parastagonospora nodorum]|nr:hypothetical protein HBI79_119150 [Parastagonospora nodorum]KAH5341409.1 hypothetical protein HBI48_233200 [Parastagonospora nodorum]KAH6200089.1 hypothetical protein HBI53_153820 [Parastagonospora nodorum]